MSFIHAYSTRVRYWRAPWMGLFETASARGVGAVHYFFSRR